MPRRAPLILLVFFLSWTFLLPAGASGEEKKNCRAIFDQAHDQRFRIDTEGPLQLTGLAGVFRAAGCEPTAINHKITREDLAGVSLVVISGPFQDFTQAEIDALVNYVLQGGSLAVMLHIPKPAVNLLARFGVITSTGVINERQSLIDHKPPNFRVSGLAGHPLTNGLEYFSFYGGWALMSEKSEIRTVAATSPLAWIDLSGNKTLDEKDAQESFPVIVAGPAGKGRIAVFGDDAIFQNSFLDRANRKLAENLITWLATGK